jgi:hypothetical protein
VSGGTLYWPPLSPREGWISDGRQVLHFRPSRWDRWAQRLEVTVGELLQGDGGGINRKVDHDRKVWKCFD